MHATVRISASLTILLACLASASAQDIFTDIKPEVIPPNPNQNREILCLPVLRVAPPVIDGEFNDPIWKRAATARDFFVTQTGLKDSEAMRARICRDDKAIYVAMEVEWTTWNFPWPDMKPSDSLAVQLNPRHPDYAVYWLGTGVPGKKWKYVAPGFLALNHDAWQVANRETKRKRYAEFAIPYETFPEGKPHEGSTWGFNLIRNRSYRGPDKYKPRNFLGTFAGTRLSWAYINSSTWSTPEQFNFIYFGTEQEYRSTGLPSTVRLYMDRRVYFDTDPAAQGYVEVDPGGRSLQSATVALSLHRGEQEVAKTGPSQTRNGKAISFHLDLSKLGEGTYRVQAQGSDQAGSSFGTASWDFEVKKNPKPLAKPPQTIPLVVWEDPRIGDLSFPISTGIPLPEGLINDAQAVRLLRDGAEVPCQASVRSRWGSKGSVKWLGLDFVATYRKGKPTGSYSLEVGKQPELAAKGPLSVKDDQDAIVVNTGPARFTISKRQFRLFDRAEFDLNRDGEFAKEEVVLEAREGDGPVFEDDKGNVYLASADTSTEVVLEESGPVKAVVHAKGWYTGRAGRMCLYSIRMFFYAGVPAARVTHSWTVTFDSDKVGVRNLALSHSLPGGVKAYRLGTLHRSYAEGKDGGLAVQPGESHYVLQSRWDQVRHVIDPPGEIKGWLNESKSWPSLGMVDVTTPGGRIIVSMRHFQQYFPKEIELRGDRLLYNLWPRHGVRCLEGELDVRNIYKLWYVHQGEVLRFPLPKPYFETLLKWFEDEGGFYGAHMASPLIANAQGVSQTNEFLYWLCRPGRSTDARSIARTFEADPHAVADPEWTCSTGVFPGLHPRDPDRFPRFERGLERFFDANVKIIEEDNGYGMFNYPDSHTYYTPGTPYMMHRVWQGQHYGQSRNCWVYYARSGQPKYYQFGKAKTRHAMDVDAVGYAERPSRYKYHFPGAVYHCKGFVHWGGDAEVIGHPTSIDHCIWAYYLTGDRRSMDLADLWGQTMLEYSLVGELDREWLQPFGDALELYDATQDPRLLKPIWEMARGAVSVDAPHGAWPTYHQLWGPRYYRMSRDPAYVEFLRDLMSENPKRADHKKLRNKPLYFPAWYTLATGDVSPWKTDKALHQALRKTTAYQFGGDDFNPALLQQRTRSWGWGHMSYLDLPACFALTIFKAAALNEEGNPAQPGPL